MTVPLSPGKLLRKEFAPTFDLFLYFLPGCFHHNHIGSRLEPGLGLPSEAARSDSLRRSRQRRFPHRPPICVLQFLRIGLVPLGSRSRGCGAVPEIGAFSLFREFTPDYLFNDTQGVNANPTPLSCQFSMPRGDNALSSEGFYKLPISFGVHSVNVDRQTTTDLQFVGTRGAVEGVHHGPLCVLVGHQYRPAWSGPEPDCT